MCTITKMITFDPSSLDFSPPRDLTPRRTLRGGIAWKTPTRRWRTSTATLPPRSSLCMMAMEVIDGLVCIPEARLLSLPKYSNTPPYAGGEVVLGEPSCCSMIAVRQGHWFGRR